MDPNHIIYKTVMTIPITKESSHIYSEDKKLEETTVRYALNCENLRIQKDHFTTVANILDQLGIKYAGMNCQMLVYKIDKFKYENGIVTIVLSYSQILQRYK